MYDLTKSSTRHDSEIKELRAEVKTLTAALQKMAYEWQREKDGAEHARQIAQLQHELLVSRLETKLLSYERGLPPTAGELSDENPL